MGQFDSPELSEMLTVLAEARVNFSPHERKHFVLAYITGVLQYHLDQEEE